MNCVICPITTFLDLSAIYRWMSSIFLLWIFFHRISDHNFSIDTNFTKKNLIFFTKTTWNQRFFQKLIFVIVDHKEYLLQPETKYIGKYYVQLLIQGSTSRVEHDCYVNEGVAGQLLVSKNKIVHNMSWRAGTAVNGLRRMTVQTTRFSAADERQPVRARWWHLVADCSIGWMTYECMLIIDKVIAKMCWRHFLRQCSLVLCVKGQGPRDVATFSRINISPPCHAVNGGQISGHETQLHPHHPVH